MNNYASFGKRFLALFIDGFALSAIGGIFACLFGYLEYLLFSWAIWFLYYWLFEGSSWNATLGKRAVGIIVVDANGNGISYSTAFLRTFGKFISSAIFLIGYLMAAFSDTSQALHDKMANTYVIEANSNNVYIPTPVNTTHNGAFLVGISGEFAGKRFLIPQSGIMLGRDNVACQIIFSNSAKGVSRHHCMVQFNTQTNMFVINDMGSSYGTFSDNGIKITSGQPLALKSGEKFYLGSRTCMFEVRI